MPPTFQNTEAIGRFHWSKPVETKRDSDDDGWGGGQGGDDERPLGDGLAEDAELVVVYSLDALLERGLPVVELDGADALEHLVHELQTRQKSETKEDPSPFC